MQLNDLIEKIEKRICDPEYEELRIQWKKLWQERDDERARIRNNFKNCISGKE